MLLGKLAASLVGSQLTGLGVIRACKGVDNSRWVWSNRNSLDSFVCECWKFNILC